MHFEAARVREGAPSGAKKVSRDTCLGHSGEGEGGELSVTAGLDNVLDMPYTCAYGIRVNDQQKYFGCS